MMKDSQLGVDRSGLKALRKTVAHRKSLKGAMWRSQSTGFSKLDGGWSMGWCGNAGYLLSMISAMVRSKSVVGLRGRLLMTDIALF